MKDYGWDIKYGIWLLVAIAASYPVFTYEPRALLYMAALILLYLGGSKLYKAKTLKSWVKCPGKLLQTEIAVYRVSLGQYSPATEHYYPLAFYNYTYNGSLLESNRYAVDHKSIWSTDIEKVETAIKQLNEIEKLEVYVNPVKPHEAALNIELSTERLSHLWALTISGLLLLCIAIFFTFYSQ